MKEVIVKLIHTFIVSLQIDRRGEEKTTRRIIILFDSHLMPLSLHLSIRIWHATYHCSLPRGMIILSLIIIETMVATIKPKTYDIVYQSTISSSPGQDAKNNQNIYRYLLLYFFLFLLYALTNFIVFSSMCLSLFVAKLALDKGNLCNSEKSEYLFFFSTCYSLSLSLIAYSRNCQNFSRRTQSVALYRKWSSWRRKSESRLSFEKLAHTHTKH